jgi:flagellar FliL protein
MANAKPKEETKPAVEGEEAPKKSKKMLFIIIGVLVLLIGGGAGYYFLGMKKEDASSDAPKKVEEAKEPIYVVLDPFTVNLKGGGQYLQMGLTLQMEDDKEGTRLKVYLPTARSRLIMLLSNKTADEITDDEGKKVLKAEIMESIKEPFSEGAKPIGISDVLFTGFVIQ